MAPHPNRPQSLPRPCLCLVTDRRRFSDARDHDKLPQLVTYIHHAIHAGIDLIQIRERDLDASELYELVLECVRAAHGTSTKIVVNDRTDVAIAAGAAGVHLRADSPDPSRIRPTVPEEFLIGRSVHSTDEAVGSLAGGDVDYLIAGSVFPTMSKPPMKESLGLDGLRMIVEHSAVPTLAIGGITLPTLRGVAATGAAGFAAIGLFAEAASEPGMLVEVVQQARHAFDTSTTLS